MTCLNHWPIYTEYYSYASFRLACRSRLCRYATWSSLAVSELQLSAATPLWLYHRVASLPSWIEFNCLRSAAVGKAARLSIYWHDAACCLVIPLRQVVLAQLYKNHHQSGNAARCKLVWKQHYRGSCLARHWLATQVSYKAVLLWLVQVGVAVRIHLGYSTTTALPSSPCWSSYSVPSQLLQLAIATAVLHFGGQK